MPADIYEDKEEVAEEATPETDEEATEQRTDDYDGLARRLDEIDRLMNDVVSKLDRIENMYSTFVDAGAIVTDATDAVAAAAAEGIAEAVENMFDLESFDYTL